MELSEGMDPVESWELTLRIETAAQGGVCVARHDGRVVFVPDVLPGELVRVRVAGAHGGPPEEDARFWRADLLEVLEASEDRVGSRWADAGPNGVGGADLAHVSLPASRRWKEQVIAEQFARLAHLTVTPRVEPAPGDDAADGLGWRTRLQFAVDATGRPGGMAPRSHRVVPVRELPLATEEIRELGIPGWRLPGARRVEVVAPRSGSRPLVAVSYAPEVPAGQAASALSALRRDHPGLSILQTAFEPGRRGRGRPGNRRPRGRGDRSGGPAAVRLPKVVAGLGEVAESVEFSWGGRRHRRTFAVSGTGFWQVHREAPGVLVDALLGAVQPRPGDSVADLYSGAGLFTAALALAVGETGSVIGIEGDRAASRDADRNLADLPWVSNRQGRVEEVLRADGGTGAGKAGGIDVVTLDPPRAGAGRAVVEQIAVRSPRIVGYVSCDPATLARDVAYFGELGYRLTALRAFDLFPLTHHVEMLATLQR